MVGWYYSGVGGEVNGRLGTGGENKILHCAQDDSKTVGMGMPALQEGNGRRASACGEIPALQNGQRRRPAGMRRHARPTGGRLRRPRLLQNRE